MSITRNKAKQQLVTDGSGYSVFTTNLVQALSDPRVVGALQAVFTDLMSKLNEEISSMRDSLRSKRCSNSTAIRTD